MVKSKTWVVMTVCIFLTSVASALAQSDDKSAGDGPSLEETMAFIKETWQGCGVMATGVYEIPSKRGRTVQDWKIKVAPVVISPSAFSIVTRQHTKLDKIPPSDEDFFQWAKEIIQEFDLKEMSPEVRLEQGPEPNLYGIRLHCARGACVTKWESGLSVRGKADWMVHPGAGNNLDELVYYGTDGKGSEHPKDKPGEKLNEAYIRVCNEAAIVSLGKAFTHAITKAGGKKPLF